MAKLLLSGGRIIDPRNGADTRQDLLLTNGVVEAIGADTQKQDNVQVIDVSGCIVAPGFIDMHVHLREPGREDEETIASGTAAAASGGFTAVACMPNTHPVNDNRSVTEFIVKRAQREGTVPVHPIGAVSVRQEGTTLAEIGAMVDAGCVAISDDGFPVATAQLMRRALEYTRIFDIPVIEHCEERSMTDGAVIHEGTMSARTGLCGWPAAAEEVTIARDLVLAEHTEGRLHIAHLSTAGGLRMVREAKERGVSVTCEVTPHHFTLTEAAVQNFDTNTKMNPPLRSAEDREALRAGLADGTVDVIATDHAPHAADEKHLEFDYAPFGILGLETALPLTCEELLHTGLIDLNRLVELLSCNPAKILGLPGGALGPGCPADITVFDPERVRRYDVDSSKSLSRNSPFDGKELRGWPVLTIAGGKVVWSEA